MGLEQHVQGGPLSPPRPSWSLVPGSGLGAHRAAADQASTGLGRQQPLLLLLPLPPACSGEDTRSSGPEAGLPPLPLSPSPPGGGGRGVGRGRRGRPTEQPDPHERLLQAQGRAGLPGGGTLLEPSVFHLPTGPAVPVPASRSLPSSPQGPRPASQNPPGLLASCLSGAAGGRCLDGHPGAQQPTSLAHSGPGPGRLAYSGGQAGSAGRP